MPAPISQVNLGPGASGVMKPVTYLDPSTVTGKKLTLQPPLRTRSGYGSKLPTSWMLRIGKRWHRVYLVCWSNSGSLYIRSKGKSLFLGDYSWQLTPFDESQNNET